MRCECGTDEVFHHGLSQQIRRQEAFRKDEVVKALHVPSVRESLASQGAEPVGSKPEEYDAFVRSEIAKWQKVCKEAGIQPE